LTLPLLGSLSTLSCKAALYMRCGCSAEEPTVGRYLRDLHFLQELSKADVCNRQLQEQVNPTVLGDRATVLEAVNRFVADEGRLATETVGLAHRGGHTDAGQEHFDHKARLLLDNDLDRCDRDFVDRLFLVVLSRCSSAACLVQAVQAVLAELGHCNGMVPSVRRDSGTRMAEIMRVAMKMSMLRRYATPSEADKLRELEAQWQEICSDLSHPQSAVSLTFDIGVDCLRRDFVHIVTRDGSITSQDLAHFTSTNIGSAKQLDRLRCLRHVSELACMSAQLKLLVDTSRRMVLKAVNYYQTPGSSSEAMPAFTSALGTSAVDRLLQALNWGEPNSLSVQCGATVLQVERGPPPDAALPLATGVRYEHRLSVVDRLRFAK